MSRFAFPSVVGESHGRMTDGLEGEDFSNVMNECRSNEVRRPALCAVLGFVIAWWGSMSMLATYDDASVFASAKTTVQTIMGYIDMAGSLTSAVLCIALAAIAVPCSFVFVRMSKRLKTISACSAAILAWSASARPFTGGKAPVSNVNWNPPTVRRGQRTVWYWMYEICRFCGFWLVLTLLVAALILFVARCASRSGSARPDGMHGEATVVGMLQASSQRFWSVCSAAKPVFVHMRAGNTASLAAIMTVCWMPWVVLMYPTNIGPDTVAQLVWGRTHHAWDPSSRQDLPAQYWMSDHHPWFDTVLYTAFDRLGLMLGNENYGLWILAVVQTCATTVALAALIAYCGTYLGVSWRLCLALTAFCCCMPVYGRFMTMIMKDTTFLEFFIAWTILFMELLRRIRNDMHMTPGFIAGFVAFALLSALTKKTGLYVILFCLLIVLIIMKRRMVSALLIVLVLFSSMASNAIADPLLHVAHAGRQEMFAVPSQQMAALRIAHDDALSASDRETVEQVLTCPVPRLKELYNPTFSDPIKDRCFNRDASMKQIAGFMAVWMKQGVRHPIVYADAVPWMLDSFAMGAKYSNDYYVRIGWEDKGGNQILPSWQSGQRSPMQRIAQVLYSTIAKIPVIGFIMSEAVYVCWLPVLAMALCVALRRWSNMMYLLPVMANVLTLFISPARQMRYTLTIVFLAALIVVIPFIRDAAGAHPSRSTTENSAAE